MLKETSAEAAPARHAGHSKRRGAWAGAHERDPPCGSTSRPGSRGGWSAATASRLHVHLHEPARLPGRPVCGHRLPAARPSPRAGQAPGAAGLRPPPPGCTSISMSTRPQPRTEGTAAARGTRCPRLSRPGNPAPRCADAERPRCQATRPKPAPTTGHSRECLASTPAAPPGPPGRAPGMWPRTPRLTAAPQPHHVTEDWLHATERVDIHQPQGI